MVQLSDDCFAFGNRPQTLDAALATIAASIPCVAGIETVPLAQADHRILAHDLIAPADLPPFANAAVDGYAVRLADLAATTALPIRGRAAAGFPAAGLHPGTAMRIFTGAPLPSGGDTVFMQEDVRADGQTAQFPPGLRLGANARPAGEDIAIGALAIPAGTILGPQHIALAAALGLPNLQVRRPLRLALFSTGNELVDPGAPLAAAQRYDSNRILLALLARRAGADVTDLGILPDTQPAITSVLSAAAAYDLILTSGGVSTGDEDHVRSAVEQLGRLVFWRIAIKPGRPVAMGKIGNAVFLGLPGNPAAAFVTFTQIARPLLAALSGASLPKPIPASIQAAFHYSKKPGRREFLRVRLQHGQAHRHPIDGAGILTSLTQTDGLVELPDDLTHVVPGDMLAFLPFSALL